MTIDPGLDPQRLAGLRPLPNSLPDLPARIRTHLNAHDGYVAFSGGKDSLVVLHLALAVDPNVPVVFFDSGFEFPETYQYLDDLRRHLDFDLRWTSARQTTLEVLRASGAWDHHAPEPAKIPKLHDVLITEPAARAHARHGAGELWGVRAEESRGRAALYARALRTETARACADCCADRAAVRRRHGGVVRRRDSTVAFGPIWDWKAHHVWGYLARHKLPINPVYDKLRRLGAPEHFLRVSHMLDAGRLEHGRVTWLRRGWPDLFEDLARVLPRLREFV
jgi:phosphoadenosine phosphosulfate reductase